MKKVAIFASGNGSNFEVIMQAIQEDRLHIDPVLLVCDRPEAYVIERAKKYKIPTLVLALKSCKNKQDYEEKILSALKEKEVSWLVLAGYMKIIETTLLDAYANRIINIHPALLPSFPGKQGILDAFDAGVEYSGITIHYVDAGVDTGPIIKQFKVTREGTDTLESFEDKIHALEHQYYPQVLEELLGETV